MMPPTLRDLVSDRRLGLNVSAGAALLDRTVSWVHTSELDDPTPFLLGGELLLTTGQPFNRSGQVDPYVHRLIEKGVAGLGFGVGLGFDSIPELLVEVAERLQLP